MKLTLTEKEIDLINYALISIVDKSDNSDAIKRDADMLVHRLMVILENAKREAK